MFSVDLLHKDMALGIEMSKKAGVPLLVSEANQKVNELARAKGFGREDTAAVVKIFEDYTGSVVKG